MRRIPGRSKAVVEPAVANHGLYHGEKRSRVAAIAEHDVVAGFGLEPRPGKRGGLLVDVLEKDSQVSPSSVGVHPPLRALVSRDGQAHSGAVEDIQVALVERAVELRRVRKRRLVVEAEDVDSPPLILGGPAKASAEPAFEVVVEGQSSTSA